MVSIIILNYNGRRFLEGCLESVLRQSYSDFEIIFFDNASTDGSVEYVKKTFTDSRIRIVESAENLGFAGGNNEALKHAGNDMIVLLNNDTIVADDWLWNLIKAMEQHNTIASSFVKTDGVKDRYYESNGSVSFLMYNVMNVFDSIEDEFYPNGCSVIFRKSEIGEPFDSDYFYYGEDVYLGLKARFMGMKVKFVKDSLVKHFGGGSAEASSRKSFFQSRNQLLNLYTFFSSGFIFKLLPIVIFIRLARTFAAIFTPGQSFKGTFVVPFWFMGNPRIIKTKAMANSAFKKVPEEDVIKYMTSKLVNRAG